MSEIDPAVLSRSYGRWLPWLLGLGCVMVAETWLGARTTHAALVISVQDVVASAGERSELVIALLDDSEPSVIDSFNFTVTSPTDSAFEFEPPTATVADAFGPQNFVVVPFDGLPFQYGVGNDGDPIDVATSTVSLFRIPFLVQEDAVPGDSVSVDIGLVQVSGTNPIAEMFPPTEFLSAVVSVSGDGEPLFGDTNLDGTLDVLDVDFLTANLRDGTDTVDLNGDMVTTSADLDVLIGEAFYTYFGDANLDGEFSTTDLIAVFSAGEYEDDAPLNSRWATGDWDGDGDFSSTDIVRAFVDGGYELGPRPARGRVGAVPEPRLLGFTLALGVWAAGALRPNDCNQRRRQA